MAITLSEFLSDSPKLYATGKCIYLKSAPGRGKTTTIIDAVDVISRATDKKLGLVIVSGPLLNPQDSIGFGLPKHTEEYAEMIFSRPFWWRTREGKRLEEYDGGIIFVDEADKMDVDIKKCIGEAALSKRLGPHDLPPGWVVWMAGNREGDRSGSTRELDHLINRRIEVPIKDDYASWEAWAFKNGVSPETITFAQQNPQIVFSDKAPEKQSPWCTPRSLVETDQLLQSFANSEGKIPTDGSVITYVAGGIGEAAAAQLFAFVRLGQEMEPLEKIIADPKGSRIPEKPDAQMLVCYSLAARIDASTADPIIQYVERMPKEFALTFARAACNRDYKLAITPAFRAWTQRNSTLMAAISRPL